LIRDGRATGVLVHIEGQGSSEISAREIVLCAGAIHSPAILLRSGIGPADELKAMGIAVERDLPVGKHFFDHPLFEPPYSCAKNFGRPTRIRVIPIVV
jgi:choline dehydrogenase